MVRRETADHLRSLRVRNITGLFEEDSTPTTFDALDHTPPDRRGHFFDCGRKSDDDQRRFPDV
jgi:hypothetical protein